MLPGEIHFLLAYKSDKYLYEMQRYGDGDTEKEIQREEVRQTEGRRNEGR